MENKYKPGNIEQRWYETWEKEGLFAPDLSAKGEPYCIVIPPPNITGTLHMGHAFQDTIMDILTRYHRMQGQPTLWQPGTDHAGIATQMVVERQLNAEDSSRQELGREKFIQKIWKWKEQSGGAITQQLRRMGASVDWSRERFTMDDGLSSAVHDVFVRLYDEGLIYRGKRLVNWDPKLHTALSDLEVLSEEEQGHLWHFRYPIDGTKDHVVVATTRPETMLGDTAVAVHPEDQRYLHLVGQKVRLPLSNRLIPIIADDYVDPEFGSGCVKITPAHDFNDYEIGKRHDLEMINIFDLSGRLNEQTPTKYQTMDRFDARKLIISDMEAVDLVEKIQEHTLTVPRGDRSGEILEPYLTEQWYVKIEPLAKPAIKAVEDGSIRFVPENWSKTYYEWMHNIQDWCISRQLWWGHRIPAWYDNSGNCYVAQNIDQVRRKHNLPNELELHQDEDVLDTWFSSALWPFSTLGWPEETKELKMFYPNSVLVTGFDIIFFWVARMIMMGIKFAGNVPFKEVYIHGLVRDADGQKMSKSKGNVLDPLDLINGIALDDLIAKRTSNLMQPHLRPKIEKATRKQYPKGINAFGMDALRFTFAALATTGRDIRFDLGRIDGYHKFCNKLWQASRYVISNASTQSTAVHEDTLADQWIRSRTHRLIVEVRENFASYRFDLAAQAIYEFTWHEFCDWYLELSKPILTQDSYSEEQKSATRKTLAEVLNALLRILHPIMPFITEEIWQHQNHQQTTTRVMTQPFPSAADFSIEAGVEREVEWIQAFILGVRQIRGEMDIPPGKPLDVLLENPSTADLERVAKHNGVLLALGRLNTINPLQADAPPSATALLGEMKILVPMADLINPDAEIERLSRQIEKIEKDRSKSMVKLNNSQFIENAPEAVVTLEKKRVTDMDGALDQLREQLEVNRQLKKDNE